MLIHDSSSTPSRTPFSHLECSGLDLLLLSTRSPRGIRHATPPPFPHQMLDTAHIMLRLAQVRQLGAPRALGRALDDLDARHVAAIHLEPHLHAQPAQLAAQLDRRLDAAPPDGHEHARKRLRGPLRRDQQDVADLRGVLVVLGEEPGARARGVHLADLVGVVRLQGRGVGPLEVCVGEGEAAQGGFGRGVDGEAGAVDGRAGLDTVGFVDEADLWGERGQLFFFFFSVCAGGC